MKLSRQERQDIKLTFRDYQGTRITKPQRKMLKGYGVEFQENKGNAHFVKDGLRLRVPLTKTHGRASKNVAQGLIRLIQGNSE